MNMEELATTLEELRGGNTERIMHIANGGMLGLGEIGQMTLAARLNLLIEHVFDGEGKEQERAEFEVVYEASVNNLLNTIMQQGMRARLTQGIGGMNGAGGVAGEMLNRAQRRQRGN